MFLRILCPPVLILLQGKDWYEIGKIGMPQPQALAA